MTAKYGMHSKLTGAGGGGCAFTLVTPGKHERKGQTVQCFVQFATQQRYETSCVRDDLDHRRCNFCLRLTRGTSIWRAARVICSCNSA